jgi:hypothetical protein
MLARLAIVFGVALGTVIFACSDDSGTIPDADPAAPVCIGNVYDNCTSNEQCLSGMCHLFSGEFQVCTQTCSASNPCPATNTEKCNNRGICKPTKNDSGSGGCRPPS